MADTIRSLSELNALLADNTSGSISPQDVRDLMVSQMVHAEIGSQGQTQETLGTGWQAVKLDIAGAFARGVAADTTNHKITGTPVLLKAEVACEIVFRGGDGVNYEFAVFKNPDGTPEQLTRFNRTLTGRGSTERTVHSWSAGIQLAAGDEIQMAVRSNGNDFKLDFGRLSLRRIGVE